ncbi:MAG TPA: 50S ribosomal protein L3 [Candidatus Megaira endosymbiont of Nemacystus decipiens]|nr:50S ribosomal protein L3 [Candidatus Megaera endosymbiont of Nemacystus decipiens]
MRTGVIGKKIGMSSMYTDQGERLTLTLLQLENCQILSHKNLDKDGYDAVVLGAVSKKPSKVLKPQKKFYTDSKLEPKAVVKEFRVTQENKLDIGTELKPSHFKVGQYIDVSGRSIGKGFAGVMKRHNFGGLEASHGVSISHRSHGSTGQCQDPGKVFKGKKMAGHLGDKNTTIQNLKVVSADDEKNILIVSGSVPGSKGKYVFVKDAVKKAF